MHINRSHYRSKGLTESNIDFLDRIALLCRTISTYTREKAYDRDDPIATKHGVFPSVLMAFCILRSIWGTHPVAQKRFEWIDNEGKQQWQHGNNFARIYADASWIERKRPFIRFENARYKSYKDDSACAVDWSDIISQRYDYKPLLLATTLNEQIHHMAARAELPDTYKLALNAVIHQLELYQFDKR